MNTYRVALLDEGEIDAVHECRPPEVCECGLQIGLRTLALFGALETKSYLTKDKISALLRGAKVRCSLMAISQARQRPV